MIPNKKKQEFNKPAMTRPPGTCYYLRHVSGQYVSNLLGNSLVRTAKLIATNEDKSLSKVTV